MRNVELIVSCIRDDNYLPPLNWSTHQHEPLQAPATAPPLPPPRGSKRHVSHPVTDGETSGYQSDNHFIDPSVNYHLRPRHQQSSPREHNVTCLPPHSPSVIKHSAKEHLDSDHHDGSNGISARADHKFLERKKWVQDGTVPYDLYPEVSFLNILNTIP